ncbi:MAG: YkgJ family cysteine cluster protein [Proteobacteria bacterium]|nr:YkgJ family cysteine cluster protein [Pseudomonadota bacterium]MBU4035375.1 YkgJ family cysteine cluster protein [Pseudomonadota bacterium]
MALNFTEFFKQYESIVSLADDLFDKVKESHPDCVKCKTKCSDCCYALFDLSLIEALYINHKFKEILDSEKRVRLEEKANTADREVFKLKKKAYDNLKSGQSEDEILKELATKKIRCPLLNEKDQCELYEFRPITCRLYGIPFSIGGIGHTCGKSGFEEGVKYPTVNMEAIQNKLFAISDEVAKSVNSKYAKLSELLMPVSMSLLTEFNKEFLGVTDINKSLKEE